MSIFVVLVLMIFAHIVDDFYLQGILASMKQKGWWAERAPDKLYRHDYIVALIVHATSWAIMISLPMFCASARNPHWALYIMLALNIVVHAVVDDLKANRKKINLITDQSIHLAQIVFNWLVWAAI